ncbi:MAG: hypothetical protein ACRDPO_39045 [Streptosporangiaceae bacterium]
MPASSRRALAAAAGAAAILSLAGPVTAATAAPAHPAAARAARPGRTGPAITLASRVDLSGYDAATDAAGTTFIGWIGNHNTATANRTIYLCTLPRGASRCAGGIASTPSLGPDSAAGLTVLTTPGGKVTLVWQHTTTASENGPDGDEIATATRQSDGSLSAAADQATAPSFGTMLDAGLSPQGDIWVVGAPASASGGLQVRPGFSHAAVNLKTPYMVSYARIAFGGGTTVLGIQKSGAITTPASYAVDNGRGWSRFRAVARTWTAGAGIGLVRTTSGIRLVATVNNADYWPVVSRFSGGSFSRPQLTGDRNNCHPSTHDLVADSSGRSADVSEECEDLAVANLTDTLHAAVFRFGSGGTLSDGTPQLTTRPSGHGWVVWSIEDQVANKLLAVPVLLAARLRTATAGVSGNRAHVTGPASCLPPETVKLGVGGTAARHWHVVSAALLLDGRAHGRSLNGAALTAGKSYTLSGRVTFADGGTRRTATARLTFRACPNP